jgi:hypothetical protein
MMVVFVIGGIFAVTGSFDHWGDRYKLKRRRRRLLRGRSNNTNITHEKNNTNNTSVPFASSNPDKASITNKGRYTYDGTRAA